MSDLDKVLDQLVSGNEDKAKETFHNMIVQQSRDEYSKLQPQTDMVVDPEDGDEVKEIKESVDKSALKAWYDKYSKYQSNNYDNLVFGMIKAWTDTGILSDAYEENEYAAVIDKFGDDKTDSMDHDQVLKMMPISKAMQDDITKIMGEWQGEETMNKVDDMLQDLGLLEYQKSTMKLHELYTVNLLEKWSKKYKKSINCSNPKGFSQRAHCAGRRKRQAGGKTKSKTVN